MCMHWKFEKKKVAGKFLFWVIGGDPTTFMNDTALARAIHANAADIASNYFKKIFIFEKLTRLLMQIWDLHGVINQTESTTDAIDSGSSSSSANSEEALWKWSSLGLLTSLVVSLVYIIATCQKTNAGTK